MSVLERAEISEDILRLTLNRPNKRNALNNELREQLTNAAREANEEERAVLIVDGAGDSFCSGADLDEGPAEEDVDLTQEMTRAIREFDGVTIAELHSHVIGGGFALSLAFDLRYAATGTTFHLPETRLGGLTMNATARLLPLIIGEGTAREVALTGREITATEADELGLVSGVYSREALEQEVLDVSRTISEERSAPSIRLIKRAFDRSFPIDDVLEHERLQTYERATLGEDRS